jgi:hypothetical protein
VRLAPALTSQASQGQRSKCNPLSRRQRQVESPGSALSCNDYMSLHSAVRMRSSEIMMLNPWIFGLEAAQQRWQAQSAMAIRIIRLFGGGVPDHAPARSVIEAAAVDTSMQEEAPATISNQRHPRNPKVTNASNKASRVRPRGAAKRAAAASQKRPSKAVRRSARKPR